jgi:ribosomal protein S13
MSPDSSKTVLSTAQAWAANWGDLASVAGIGLTLVGFTLTLVGVVRAKKAAELAKTAAVEVKTSLLLVDTVADLASALAMMEEIKRLHRAAAWPVLPDRYSILRRLLIRIKSSNHLVDAESQRSIQLAIEQLMTVEQRVDTALARGDTPSNPAKLNQVVSAQIDSVEVVLRNLQRQ